MSIAPDLNQMEKGPDAPAVRPRSGSMPALWRALAMGVLVLFTAGCTTPYEGRYDFYEGWRKAEVMRIERFEKLSPYEVPGCRSKPLPQAVDGSTWAVVRYRAGRRSRHVAVPLKQADDYKVGELVYVNVSECARYIQKRVVAD